MPSLVGLAFHLPPGLFLSISVCLSFDVSVALYNITVCAPNFTMKALEYRNASDTLDRGRFVVVHP